MYLTIMKPEVLQDVASLGRGLWIVEGPDGPALVVKTGKEFILAAREKRELKFYLAPYESDEAQGLTLLTTCFDDPISSLQCDKDAGLFGAFGKTQKPSR